MLTVTCHHCGNPAKLVSGQQIYATVTHLHRKWFWQCLPCGAHVGTHKNSKRHVPLGRLANKDERLWRSRAHAVFDPLWQNKKYNWRRPDLYAVLAKHLEIPFDQCHIGLFDVEQCKRVVKFCQLERGLQMRNK